VPLVHAVESQPVLCLPLSVLSSQAETMPAGAGPKNFEKPWDSERSGICAKRGASLPTRTLGGVIPLGAVTEQPACHGVEASVPCI
jgi:hypothetical protein